MFFDLFSRNLKKRIKDNTRRSNEQLDFIKSRIDVGDALFDQFQQERYTDEYRSVFALDEPLVTVCVATFNRSRLLVDRCLRSIQAQSYQRLEIIVVGDCCTDDTAELIARISDARLRFVNLPERGRYPVEPDWCWMVAGTAAVNHALMLASGHFITHLDDDDECPEDRIALLVDHCKKNQADFAWHPFWHEDHKGRWRLNEATDFAVNQITTSSVFYHHWLKRIPWDINAYRYREPGDWNRFRKFKYLGVKACRYPEPLLRHYKERNQRAAGACT